MLHPDAPIKVLDEVVIAAENKPRHRNNPNLVLLPNGDLLLVYGLAADHHVTCDGVVVSRRSSDGGKTWSDPRPIFAQPGFHYSETNGMTQFADGRIMLHVWEWRFRRPEDGPGPLTHHRHRVVRILRTFSDDNGLNWTEPQTIVPRPPFITYEWSYGRAHELQDGRIMVPLYGPVQEGVETGDPGTRLYPGEAWDMTVAFSSDGGRTFPELSTMASNRAEGHLFNETDILRLRDGRFLAILRDGKPPKWSHKSYSADEGKTWTPYEQVNFKGECPFLVQLRSGAVLCAYRDVEGSSPDRSMAASQSRSDGSSRPGVSVSVSEDDGETWRWVGQLYSGANWDCAYPVFVRLPDGRLFCSYYTSFVDGDCEIRGMWLSDDV